MYKGTAPCGEDRDIKFSIQFIIFHNNSIFDTFIFNSAGKDRKQYHDCI